MSPNILAEREGHILKLTIDRLERKNALSLSMYQSLAEQIRSAPNDGVRVILLTGGPDCFTSGNDLEDFAKGADLTDEQNPIALFIHVLAACPIPVVVAVNGVAVGIGSTLLMHSDLVYASASAKFRLPFVNLGLVPEFASSYVLPRLAGHVKAAEWLMLGEFFSADDAFGVGLINEVVADPIARALEQAQKLAAQPPSALREAKALMKAPQSDAISKVIQAEFELFGRALNGPEFAEAAAAFFEKRAPDFSSCK